MKKLIFALAFPLFLALLYPLCGHLGATEVASEYTGITQEQKQAIERIDCTFSLYRDEGVTSAAWDELVVLLEQAQGDFHASDEEIEVLIDRFHEIMKKMYATSKDESSIHGELTLSGVW